MRAKELLAVTVLVLAFSATSFSQFDWGDAPDPPYPTVAASGGAFHQIWPGIQMGVFNDPEGNGQPNFNATGDDLALPDDADGVVFNSWIIGGQTASVIITITGPPGMIDGWIDFNLINGWADPGEQIFANQPVNPGVNNLTFNVPGGIAAGLSFARIRYSIPGMLGPGGFAPDGEVEDYQLWLGPSPFIDICIDPDPSMAFTQNEISLACIPDPNFGPPSLLVAAYNDEPFAGGPGLGVSYSADGGVNWFNTQLAYPINPFSAGGAPFVDAFDPTVCIDDSGHVFVGHISTDNNWGAGPASGLYVHKSADGGVTWQVPVQVDANGPPVSTPDTAYRFNDRDQIISDNYPMSPYYNNIYITWIKDRGWNQPFQPWGDIYFSYSTNGGNTFSASQRINAWANNMGNMPTVDVAKDGTVYVAWMNYNVQTGGIGNIFLDVSPDGGVTFGPDIPVYNVNLPPINLNGGTDARAKGAAVLKVQPSNPQVLYIVFAENPVNPLDEADIFLIKSTNGGNTWGIPVLVNDDGTDRDQILPWMDIKPNGIIDIAWYDRRNDPLDQQWDVYFTSSTDGGVTFAPNIQVSTNSFVTPGPWKVTDRWMGEYLGLAADYNHAFMVYTSSFFDYNGDVLFVQADNPDLEVDWGDAPDDATHQYATLAINDGARHSIDGVTYLGVLVDPEPDGIPNTMALGDDLHNLADEDGVFFPTLRQGNAVTLLVLANTGGILNGWFDYNADGDWADAGEHAILNLGITGVMNFVPLNIPKAANTGTTYARFRFATYGGLSYSGGASDGEVEDYQVTIKPYVPQDTSVNSVTIGSGQSQCYDAIDTLLVANTAPVVVQNGGSAIFIAGNVVLFKPGFHGQWGSYVDAHITIAGNYCNNPTGASVVTNPVDVDLIPEEPELFSKETSDIKLYPNPNTGQFTIDFMKDEYSAVIRVMNFQGAKLYQNQFINQRRIKLDLSTQSSGIYLVVIQMDGKVVTRKVVKN